MSAELLDESGGGSSVELGEAKPFVPRGQDNFTAESGMEDDDEAVSITAKETGPRVQCFEYRSRRLVVVDHNHPTSEAWTSSVGARGES